MPQPTQLPASRKISAVVRQRVFEHADDRRRLDRRGVRRVLLRVEERRLRLDRRDLRLPRRDGRGVRRKLHQQLGIGQRADERARFGDDAERDRERAADRLLIEIDLDERCAAAGCAGARHQHRIPVVAGQAAQAGGDHQEAVVRRRCLLHPHRPPGVAGEAVDAQRERMRSRGRCPCRRPWSSRESRSARRTRPARRASTDRGAPRGSRCRGR